MSASLMYRIPLLTLSCILALFGVVDVAQANSKTLEPFMQSQSPDAANVSETTSTTPFVRGLNYERIYDPDLEQETYKNLPESTKFVGGIMLDDPTTAGQPLILEQIVYQGRHLILLERIVATETAARQRGYWQRMSYDVLDAKEIEAGSHFTASVGGLAPICQQNQQPDPNVIAVMKNKTPVDINAEWFTQYEQAWVLNRNNELLEAISPTTVRCLNPLPGGD